MAEKTPPADGEPKDEGRAPEGLVGRLLDYELERAPIVQRQNVTALRRLHSAPTGSTRPPPLLYCASWGQSESRSEM
jgi:hypothetical protein